MNRRRLSVLAGAVVLLPLLGLALTGDLVAQKVLAYFVMPSGLLFLGLGAATIWAFLKKLRPLGSMLALLFFGYTLAGNSCVAVALMNSLEADFPPRSISSTPEVDALLVLGGGAALPPDGEAKISDYGDRVVLAARLYHAGKIKVLVTSGSSMSGLTYPQDLSEATRRIWVDLKIPDETILRLPEPKNTSQEIAAFKELASKRDWKRLGILSSAWHLPRVRALAEKAGLQVELVAADRRGGDLGFVPAAIIPQPGAFKLTQNALWEFVGRAVGR